MEKILWLAEQSNVKNKKRSGGKKAGQVLIKWTSIMDDLLVTHVRIQRAYIKTNKTLAEKWTQVIVGLWRESSFSRLGIPPISNKSAQDHFEKIFTSFKIKYGMDNAGANLSGNQPVQDLNSMDSMLYSMYEEINRAGEEKEKDKIEGEKKRAKIDATQMAFLSKIGGATRTTPVKIPEAVYSSALTHSSNDISNSGSINSISGSSKISNSSAKRRLDEAKEVIDFMEKLEDLSKSETDKFELLENSIKDSSSRTIAAVNKSSEINVIAIQNLNDSITNGFHSLINAIYLLNQNK
jgi:hypothetical protein